MARQADRHATGQSLWRAWEHLRDDAATGLSMWFRDHAEHHMTILLDADGPFEGCDSRHSEQPLDELPHIPPPEGMFAFEEPANGATPRGRASGTPAARNGARWREHTIRHRR